MRRPFGLKLVIAVVVLLSAPHLAGQDTSTFFRTNCYSCHTIGGGRVTGPDLKGVLDRKDRAWLTNFIRNPKAVIDSGDSYALELMKEARNVIMPTVPGLDAAMAIALLDLIEEEGRLEESNFMGLQLSDTPISDEDVFRGQLIFTGRTRLLNRGPACISCHSVSNTGLLGGGRIGPDLTRVYERLGGRTALATWLLSPSSATMGSVFRDQPLAQNEIPLIAAFLEFHAKNSLEQPAATGATYFLLLGFCGVSFGLGAIAFTWRRRISRSLKSSTIER